MKSSTYSSIKVICLTWLMYDFQPIWYISNTPNKRYHGIVTVHNNIKNDSTRSFISAFPMLNFEDWTRCFFLWNNNNLMPFKVIFIMSMLLVSRDCVYCRWYWLTTATTGRYVERHSDDISTEFRSIYRSLMSADTTCSKTRSVISTAHSFLWTF